MKVRAREWNAFLINFFFCCCCILYPVRMSLSSRISAFPCLLWLVRDTCSNQHKSFQFFRGFSYTFPALSRVQVRLPAKNFYWQRQKMVKRCRKEELFILMKQQKTTKMLLGCEVGNICTTKFFSLFSPRSLDAI